MRWRDRVAARSIGVFSYVGVWNTRTLTASAVEMKVQRSVFRGSASKPRGSEVARTLSRRWSLFFVALVVATLLLSGNLQAQQSTRASSNESWGSWKWQVDEASSTITLSAEARFEKPSGFVHIPVSIRHANTIQHVHGSVSLSVPQAGVNGSIIAMLRDQDGNALAAVKMQQFGDAIATVPIDATFDCDLPVTSLQLQYYVDMPGTQVVTMSITMN